MILLTLKLPVRRIVVAMGVTIFLLAIATVSLCSRALAAPDSPKPAADTAPADQGAVPPPPAGTSVVAPKTAGPLTTLPSGRALVRPGSSAAILTLDIESLMRDKQLFSTQFTEGFWTLTPPVGRKVIVLPLNVSRPTQDTTLDPNLFTLSGAQFVAWHIPATADAPPEPPFIVAPDKPPYRTTIPRLSHDIWITTDGKIHWKLSRTLNGGKAAVAGQLYAMQLDRTLLVRPEAPKPVVRTSNQSAAELNRLRNEAAETHRKNMAAYQATTKALADLPVEFEQSAPTRLYAIYYLLPQQNMSFGGPDPLPWRISTDHFEAARKVISDGSDVVSMRNIMTSLFNASDPLSKRTAAIVLASAVGSIPLDAPELMEIAEKIHTESEPAVRAQLVSAMAGRPQVPMVQRLLTRSFNDAQPQIALTAMRAMVARTSDKLTIAMPVDVMAETVNRILAQPGAVRIDQILAAPLDYSRMSPAAVMALGRDIKFTAVPPANREALVRLILAHARRGSLVANRWLDAGLLGADNLDLVKLTLTVLAQGPEAPPTAPRAQVEHHDTPYIFAQFEGLPQRNVIPSKIIPKTQDLTPPPSAPPAPPHSATPAPPAPPTPPATAAPGSVAALPASAPKSDASKAIEPAPLPEGPQKLLRIDSDRHNIIRLLSSGDPAIRALAWTALAQFTIPTHDLNLSAPFEGAPAVFAAITSAATKLDPSPMEAANFFKAQPDEKLRNGAVLKLLADGHGPVQATALATIAGSGASAIASALTSTPPDARQTVANAWFDAAGPADAQRASDRLVLPLLSEQPASADKSVPVIQWFAGEVAKGKHPRASLWFDAVGSQTIVAGLTSSDTAYATACAAAIIAKALPPDARSAAKLQQDAAKIGAIADAAERTKQLMQLIRQGPEDVVAQYLLDSAGDYKVEAVILPPPPVKPTDGKPTPPPPPGRKLFVGYIRATVVGKVMTFEPTLNSNIEEHQLRIKFQAPVQFAQIHPPGEPPVQMEWPKTYMEFYAEENHRWIGAIPMVDQSRLEMTLTKVPPGTMPANALDKLPEKAPDKPAEITTPAK